MSDACPADVSESDKTDKRNRFVDKSVQDVLKQTPRMQVTLETLWLNRVADCV